MSTFARLAFGDVLHSFDSKAGRGKDVLWDALGEWAAALVENRVAHVVVLSDNIAISKPLSKGGLHLCTLRSAQYRCPVQLYRASRST